ncbi:MAG: DUF11 domain-containing protein [Bifidobacteriaceae bacterium]|jgi:uncharacterized repeat protein (TIGR01451 family)|nr:DUF11 domain-containing protein [Bifidobacteriaceae bacterium]
MRPHLLGHATALKRASAGLVAVVLVAALGIITHAPSATAASTVPFAQRFQTNANGAIISIGNNLMTCHMSVSNCAAARAGEAIANNYYMMDHLDADSDASTFNSSASTLALPDGAQVLWAGLYWGARLRAGTNGQAASGNRSQMQLKVPGASSYQTIVSAQEYGPNTSSSQAYQEFADVTALVQGAGNGSYWGANVVAATGADRYAGWALTVVYQAPGLPLRNLTVFDGFEYISSGSTQTITVSGFQAPTSGQVDTQLTMVAYEGDLPTSGDYTKFNATQLATAISPGSNFFNSTNDMNGTSVTSRIPADRNMLGFDIKNLGASGAVQNGDTSATFTFSSNGDVYFPGVLGMAINLYAPDFTASTKTVTNLSGSTGTAQPGDTLQYTIAYANTGQDAADGVVSSDVLPPGVDYIYGSLVLLSSPDPCVATPAHISDYGSSYGYYDAATRKVSLNLGGDKAESNCGTATANRPTTWNAASAHGGQLQPGDTQYYQFQVKVLPAAGGTVLSNIASLDYTTDTTHLTARYDTPPAQITVARLADVSINKSMSPSPAIAGQPGTTTLTVTNHGPNTAVNVVVTDSIPATYAATEVTSSTGSTCTLPATTQPVTCAIGDLASGDSATVTIKGRPDPSTTATTLTNIAQVNTDSVDPNRSNNVDTVSIPMTHQADLKIAKTPASTTATPGATITWRLTVTNQCPSPATGTCLSDATDVVITDTVADPSKLVLLSATGGSGTGGTQGDVAVTCPATLASNATVRCTVNAALAPGETATVAVTGYVPANVAAGTAGVTNNAAVTSATLDPTQGDAMTTANVTVGAPVADLGVVKTGPTTAVAGQTVRYTFKVTNYGPADATNANLTDTLPAGLSFTPAASANTDHGSCSIGGNTLTCQFGTLGGPASPTSGAGATATVAVAGVLVASSATGSLTNTATVASDAAEPSNNPHPNTATATTAITQQADVAVSKSSTVTTVPDPSSSDQVPYTIVVTNLGPSDATGVTLTDTLPIAALAYVPGSVTTSQGTCQAPSGATLTCNLGTLAVGVSATVTLTMQEAGLYNAGTKPASFQQVATVTANGDPNLDNNTATWTNSGSDQADLAITKTSSGIIAGGDPADFGAPPNTGYYDLTVTNSGPTQATFPRITDTLPTGLTIKTATLPAECSAAGQVVTCNKATDLANGGTWGPLRIEFEVGAIAGGTQITNTATVSSVTADPTLGNNSASVTDQVHHIADVEVDSYTITPAGSYTGPGSTWHVSIHVKNNGPSVAQGVQVLSNVAVTSLIDTSSLPAWCHAVNQELACDVSQEAQVQAAGGFLPQMDLTITFDFQVAPSDAAGTFPACTPSNYDPYDGPACTTPGGWAQISATTNESLYTNNGLTAAMAVSAPQTDLDVTKTALSTVTNTDFHPAYVAGAKFGYQVDIKAGADAADAAGVVVTDTLPAGFHATQVNTSLGTCDITSTGAGSDDLITCQLGTVQAGQGSTAHVVTLFVYGSIDDDVVAEISGAGGAVNHVTVTSTTAALGGGATAVSAQVADDVIQQADLQQFKTADSTTFYAGSPAGYTLTTVNAGPSAVEDAVVTDTLPVGLVPALANAAASSGDADYLLLASPPNSAGCYVDRVPTSPASDPASDTNTTPYVVTCQIGHIDAGDRVSVRVVGNTDPRDLRPYWCPGQNPATDPVANCTEIAAPADPSDEHPRSLQNAATVSSATATDTLTINNSATNTTEMQVMADIAVTASVDINTPAAGTDVKFTLTGVNLGPSTADHPVTDATFPKGFVINCPDGPANSCAAVNIPTMDCSVAHTGTGLDVVYTVHCVGWPQTPYRDSFQPSLTTPGTVTVHVPDDIAAGTYTAASVTTTTTPESDYTTNAAQATVIVVTVANTTVVKTLVSPNPLVVGRPATYRLTATNAGPSVARDVIISDAVPDGTSFISAQVVGGGSCPAPEVRDNIQVVNCSVGALDPGESASVEVVFDVPKDYTGELCNSALVGSGALDPASGDNETQACNQSQLPPKADVAVTVTPAKGSLRPGETATYQAVVQNNGPAATEGTVVKFTLPNGLSGAEVTLLGGSAGTAPAAACVAQGSEVTCDIGDLPVGATVRYQITGRATGGAGTRLVVQASVTHYDIDTNPANDTAAGEIDLVAPPSPTPTVTPTATATPTPTATASPSVTPSTSPSPGASLPVTGSNAAGLAWWALAIVLLGLGLRWQGHLRLAVLAAGGRRPRHQPKHRA